MPISAKIIVDSINPNGNRLITFQVTCPRIILAEVATHRMLARSASSSRAIPVASMIERVENDPFIPEAIGKNRPGMQALEELEAAEKAAAIDTWLDARKAAVIYAKSLASLGVHKQLANRLIEPWMYTSVIITGTEWTNFFALRLNRDAQPEFRALAYTMAKAFLASTAQTKKWGQWHLPYITDAEFMLYGNEKLCPASAARCARVSYLNHDGSTPDMAKDLTLAERLRESGHMSPFDHLAFAINGPVQDTAHLRGWMPYRKTLKNENIEEVDLAALVAAYELEKGINEK